ncbi:carboxypeptidase-like regulatory domain-containing protein [Lewinella sp. 4G2]|uniref:Ig-like domain-containing protein n=1 Tax=Lewinella sp. 4G2 TaxID=1803372 RepID=UPI0007B48A64|nr:carboxypeptidase-like regulatory domain-containing protein [Lewinella sp. 4G2]OAV46221.1 hypothetical protein A3850_018370 [Lewinella sp. 4G2]
MPTKLLATFLFLGLLCLPFLGLQRCATPTAPTGGPRDSLGPVLVVEESTPNFQTNFRPEEIVLTFDEWVEIDPKQPILISPPLELGELNRPQLRRRSLVINLEGLELRDSVTYVVNIDAAIKDLNEGNPTDNLRFVFATGPVLDSATVSGTLVTDFSGEPIENGTFTLFSNLADTAVTTENPTYFAQTDEDGKFTVYNIRPGTYRAVALQRNPSATNYFYDLKGYAQPQSAGFVDSLITIEDGTNEVGTIRLSPIQKPVRINAVDMTVNGVIRLTVNQAAELVDLEYSGDYERQDLNDTIALFYRTPTVDTVFAVRNGERVDTVVMEGQPGAVVRNFRLLRSPGSRIFTGDGIEVLLDRPLERLDTSLVSLTQDTFTARLPYTYALDSTQAGRITFQRKFNPSSRYELSFLPGALTDWVGNVNTDTIVTRFTADEEEKYGSLALQLTDLDPTSNYILRLVQNDKVLIATRRYVEKRFAYDVTYRGLKPGTYTVELLYDSNENNRYDSGDFLFGRQPEEVRRIEVEPLRANWEVEQVISLKTGGEREAVEER